MGLGGAVNILHKVELAAFTDPSARAKRHAELTDELKREHAAVEAAGKFIYDNVIDPADTREMLLRAAAGARVRKVRSSISRVSRATSCACIGHAEADARRFILSPAHSLARRWPARTTDRRHPHDPL